VKDNLDKPWDWDGLSINKFSYCEKIHFIKLKKIRDKVKVWKFNRYKLTLLIKTKAFCEWYYHPENIGGIIAKRRLNNLFFKITCNFLIKK